MRGKKLGRPPVLDKRGLQRARRMAKAGRTTRQIAEVLGISKRTVEADWTMIKAWLRRELADEDRS